MGKQSRHIVQVLEDYVASLIVIGSADASGMCAHLNALNIGRNNLTRESEHCFLCILEIDQFGAFGFVHFFAAQLHLAACSGHNARFSTSDQRT